MNSRELLMLSLLESETEKDAGFYDFSKKQLPTFRNTLAYVVNKGKKVPGGRTAISAAKESGKMMSNPKLVALNAIPGSGLGFASAGLAKALAKNIKKKRLK